jgi:two-component system, OmpR family, aerobic respiration control sensor histidine kinase ArcB
MTDENKTKEQLIKELSNLRQRVAELEVSKNQFIENEETLKIFRTNMPIGLFIIQDGRFKFVNDNLRALLADVSDEIIESYSMKLVYPDDRERVRESAIKILRGESTTPYKYRIIDKEGQIRWLLESVASIQYQGRRAILGHAMDITEREMAQVRLEEAYEKERRLRQELQVEVQRRVEFTRALVHELKTPLTPIMSSSDLLVSGLKEEPWLSVAQNIQRGAINLNKRIGELLDLARGEIGMLRLNPKRVNFLKQLQHVGSEMSVVASSNGQLLKVELPETLSQPWADSDRLLQITQNLLVNATKFTPEGGTITLRAKEENGSIVVEVQDTGYGIPEEEQRRLFRPYHRQTGDREHLSGLGLGLALCKNLVQLHGGRIWVRSQEGKGSTFSFSIPINSRAQQAGTTI